MILRLFDLFAAPPGCLQNYPNDATSCELLAHLWGRASRFDPWKATSGQNINADTVLNQWTTADRARDVDVALNSALDQLAYFPLSPQEMQLTRHFINSMYVALKISLEPRKLENFLYENKNSDFLKLIDFGFSKVWAKNTKMELSCGTLSYAAPEVLAKSYTSQCDLWSLGVIVFILLVSWT